MIETSGFLLLSSKTEGVAKKAVHMVKQMTDNLYIKTTSRAGLALPGLVCLLFLWGCAITSGTPDRPSNGTYHTVKRGETLWRISKDYGVSVKELAAANNIKGPSDLDAGKRIFIPLKGFDPGVSAVKPSKKQAKNIRKNPSTPVGVENEPRDNRVHISRTWSPSRTKFSWPVRGDLYSRFGLRDGVRHDGIDIRVPEGTPIKAADAGQVAYISTNMRGYGNIIILRHRDGFYTVYAHSKYNLVKPGDTVDKGAVIATAGANGAESVTDTKSVTGNTEAAHLHFEVRQGKRTLDPLFYLP